MKNKKGMKPYFYDSIPAFCSAYGNRTRVSAVRGPRPNR